MIVVVSGLPRSGTSLMMQMLQAGGMPLLIDDLRMPDADNPNGYWEYEPVKRLQQDSSWIPKAEGKAVKVVSALLQYLPQHTTRSSLCNGLCKRSGLSEGHARAAGRTVVRPMIRHSGCLCAASRPHRALAGNAATHHGSVRELSGNHCRSGSATRRNFSICPLPLMQWLVPLIHACTGSEYRKIKRPFPPPAAPRLAGHLRCREGTNAHCEGQPAGLCVSRPQWGCGRSRRGRPSPAGLRRPPQRAGQGAT